MINTQEVIASLTVLKPEIISRYKAKEIGLFGSFVRDEQKNDSDIDVLADFDEEADLFDLIGLAQFLEEKLNRKVDVVPKNALRKEIRESVLREVVVI